MSSEVEQARECYAAKRWEEAYDGFRAAERTATLDAEDLDRLAWSAALVGDDETSVATFDRLHRVCVDASQHSQAVRACFWAGFRLLGLGESARGMGYLARAQRLLAELGDEPCAERGYLMLPSVYRQLGSGDDRAAERIASEAATIGERYNEPDLVAIARNLQGRAALRQNKLDEGHALLDEVMFAVTSGELSPLVSGLVYCNVIATCNQMYAVDRAKAWTIALSNWYETQPQLVTFTGFCLVHRSQVLQLGGRWSEALEEVTRACNRSGRVEPDAFGEAYYQRAELLRLLGDHSGAEAAYQRAGDHGKDPQPGLALLRLAQGRADDAMGAMDRVYASSVSAWQRAQILPAFVEVALAAEQVDKARGASEELTEIAESFGTEVLGALAAHARAAIELSNGEPLRAISEVRAALSVWNRVDAPYIAARLRVTLARAYDAVGDHDGAKLEFAGARRVFVELGAQPDIDALSESRTVGRGQLSPREFEVLQLLASGMTNKAIAQKLFVSERTVDRHVSNIFTKIHVSSRAAATAYAYRNQLV